MGSDSLSRLIVVTGRPGSGKTTLAHVLARQIRCPAICRDEIKEGYLNTLGHGHAHEDATALHAYNVFFEAITLLLGKRITLVAEAAFQHKLWAPRLEALRSHARLFVVVCTVDAAFAQARHAQRSANDPKRSQFHADPRVGEYDPPHLDVPTLSVDTRDGYRPNLQQVVDFVSA